jgi:hypothetical protein
MMSIHGREYALAAIWITLCAAISYVATIALADPFLAARFS